MKISNLQSEINGEMARIAATIIWEDSDRPDKEIYFATTAEFATELTCNPHAFLVASFLAAMRHGEKRITMDAEICPLLKDGLATVMAWFSRWYSEKRTPVRIETKTQQRAPKYPTRHAASFLSGGVDSLATLYANRRDYPLGHQLSIREGFFVYGFDIGGYETIGEQLDSYKLAMASVQRIAEDAGVTVLPVFTNVKHIDDNLHFWEYEFVSAALAAVGHAFVKRVGTVNIAATSCIRYPVIEHGGSHPLIDSNYSSADLSVRHDGIRLSRLDKVKLAASRPVALQDMRVCTTNRLGMLNCGECEKCIRTMLALLAIGKLAEATAFPHRDVAPQLLANVQIHSSDVDAYYAELIEPLRAIGRHDLARIIEYKRVEYRQEPIWLHDPGWKPAIKRFDRRYLGGNFLKTKTRLQTLLPYRP